MFAYGSGDSCMQIKKFKDALAKHKPDRCSIGPTKGLEEQELFALAANKDLQFTYTMEPELAPSMEDAAEFITPERPTPTKPLVRQGSDDRTLVPTGRWYVITITCFSSVQFSIVFVCTGCSFLWLRVQASRFFKYEAGPLCLQVVKNVVWVAKGVVDLLSSGSCMVVIWIHLIVKKNHLLDLCSVTHFMNSCAWVPHRKWYDGCFFTNLCRYLWNSNQAHLLSYYLANKRSLHVRSQSLEISTLIGEK